MAGHSLRISVEKLLEQQVDEISRTGEEKYIRPLTISEELTELAQKIDFDDKGDKGSPVEDEGDSDNELNESDQKDKIQGKKDKSWPWESLQTKLRTTMQEVCVLLDVLQTVKQRKYIVLDPVTQKEEPPKPTVQMLGKRKSLKRAADIIYQGANRMECKTKTNDSQEITVDRKDYFHELMKLRQRWRVKKSGNFIMGDLSYKTAGSTYWHQGLFEVSKTEWEGEKEAAESSEEALTVKVGSDLEGLTRTVFEIKGTELEGKTAFPQGSSSTVYENGMPEAISWHQQLERSQHNLFCKELFVQLAREAYSCSSYSSTELSRDEIEVKLPFGFLLSVVNKKDTDEKKNDGNTRNEDSVIGQYLQYRAEMLLRSQHKQYLTQASDKSLTAIGSGASPADSLSCFFTKRKTGNQATLFEKLVSEARHSILRDLTAKTIDKVTSSYADPIISSHWGMISSPTRSAVTVFLLSRKCGFCYRSSFHIEVCHSGYHIVTHTGLAVDVSGHTERLEDFFQSMISQHLLEVAQLRLEHFGWAVRQVNKTTLLHLSSNVESNEMVPGVLAESTSGMRLTILFKTGNQYHVMLERYKTTEKNETIETLLGKEWLSNIQSREDVNFKRMYGNSFVEKLDSLLAVLGICT